MLVNLILKLIVVSMQHKFEGFLFDNTVILITDLLGVIIMLVRWFFKLWGSEKCLNYVQVERRVEIQVRKKSLSAPN